jgi:hypothetical protein
MVAPPLVIPIRERGMRRSDQLAAVYDQFPPEFRADFDGDGVLGHGALETHEQRETLGEFVARDGGREILRLPFEYRDGTLRTHVAVVESGGTPRVLVYDGMSAPQTRAVFAFSGERMVAVTPSELESEIIAAMADHDDTGGWPRLVTYKVLKGPTIVGWYLLVTIVAALYLRSQLGKRSSSVNDRHETATRL